MKREELIEAQKKLCKEHGWPMFAPFDGRCSRCSQDIVTAHEWRWTSDHITGCPECFESYCE